MAERILSLSMIKMEKNFTAHIDKDYSRKPHQEYTLVDPDDTWISLIGFVKREMIELEQAIDILNKHVQNHQRTGTPTKSMIRDQTYEAMLEVADISNTLDYLFEGLLTLHTRLGEVD